MLPRARPVRTPGIPDYIKTIPITESSFIYLTKPTVKPRKIIKVPPAEVKKKTRKYRMNKEPVFG